MYNIFFMVCIFFCIMFRNGDISQCVPNIFCLLIVKNIRLTAEDMDMANLSRLDKKAFDNIKLLSVSFHFI